MIIGIFLGVVMVLGLLGVVVMVKMYSNIKKLKKGLKGQTEINQSIFHRLEELDQMINRRIDGEIDRVDSMYTETNRYINDRINEVHRTMDSRLDKLDNKRDEVEKRLLLELEGIMRHYDSIIKDIRYDLQNKELLKD